MVFSPTYPQCLSDQPKPSDYPLECGAVVIATILDAEMIWISGVLSTVFKCRA
jgi:hypothetical protein